MDGILNVNTPRLSPRGVVCGCWLVCDCVNGLSFLVAQSPIATSMASDRVVAIPSESLHDGGRPIAGTLAYEQMWWQ